jgi:predicted enzyme related to lactoylglutathione lyase
MANPFVHVELMTTDINKSKEFYKSLFRWQFEDTAEHDYTMIKVGEGTGGGMMRHPVPGQPSQWLAYVLVDDIKASTEKAKSLGANIVKPVTEIPGVGSFSIMIDPTGASLAMFEPKEQMKGQRREQGMDVSAQN